MQKVANNAASIYNLLTVSILIRRYFYTVSTELSKTLVPNFHTWSIFSCFKPFSSTCSSMITRSASASPSSVPLVPLNPSIAAGVDVTAFKACGIVAPDQFRKFVTHSISVMELSLISYSYFIELKLCFACAYLPAILSLPSNTRCAPFLIILSPLVHS